MPESRPAPYILPFVTLVVLLAAGTYVPLGPEWQYPLRTLLVVLAIVLVSRGVVALRPSRPWASVALGIAVFAIWVAPEALFPEWRHHWLFANVLTAGASKVVPAGLRGDVVFLFFRAAGSALVVPIAEELFWRSWMMRRLISPEFEKIPLGTYSSTSFWVTAVLFATEHGAYWDVGFAAGVLYNWWMLRSRSLADCILAHAVTNGCLAAYVLSLGHWQYWF